MNQNVQQLADMPWSKVIFVGLGCLAFYYFAFYDDGTSLKDARRQATQNLLEAEKQLKSTKEAIADADRFEREVKETAAQFEHIVNFMPEKMGSAELTTIISDQASRAGVRVMKTEPKNEASQTSEGGPNFYSTSKVQFHIEGNFTQIASFLSHISRVPKLMTFDKVEITAAEGGNLEAPKLNFNGTLVGYRYHKVVAPPETDGSGSEEGGGVSNAQ